MYIQEKGCHGSELSPIETVLMTQRCIVLEGAIDQAKACELLKQILVLNSLDPQHPIHLLIDSPGGEVTAGLQIYDLIQTSEAPVRTYCVGAAYSMAAILFACGEHGRFMLPHAELMLHEPSLGTQIVGNASSVKALSDSMIETRRKLNQLLASHTGKPAYEVEDATRYEHFFTAEESIEFGLCDEIVGLNKIVKELKNDNR